MRKDEDIKLAVSYWPLGVLPCVILKKRGIDVKD
jgi:hypothetical protein